MLPIFEQTYKWLDMYFSGKEPDFTPPLIMKTTEFRKAVLDYGLSFPDTYQDAPFHDPNWILVRVRTNKKAFLWTYERNGQLCINVKVDPEWRDFWRTAYEAVQPGYHQNKNHWNTVILDGTIPVHEIQRMIAESYDLVVWLYPWSNNWIWFRGIIFLRFWSLE